MNKAIIILIVICLTFSFKAFGQKKDSDFSPYEFDKLEQLKLAITMIELNSAGNSVYAIKAKGENELLPIRDDEDDNIPNDAILYSFYKDKSGLIRKVTEFYTPGDGNGFILSYFFDEQGKTFCFTQEGLFQCDYSETLVFAVRVAIYDENFKLIFEDNKLEDETGSPLPKDYCKISEDNKNGVYKEINEYFTAQNITKQQLDALLGNQSL
jgi:hypothetical protein